MAHTVFAADLGGTKLTAALVDRRGKILVRRTEAVNHSSRLAPVRQICRLAAELGETVWRVRRPRAAGVAVPGLVRPTGTVWAPNLSGWKSVPLERLLRQKLGIPVVVESDRNAAVLGEAWRGAARGQSDAIVLIVGTGIGAGILSGGRLVRGAHELSGCVGWMALAVAPRTKSRKIGALEALTAGPAIAYSGRRARLGRGDLSAQEVAAAACLGNLRARRIFEDAGRRLGLAVANLISLLDPKVLILSGGLAGASQLFLPALRRAVLQHAQPISAREVRIRVSRLGAAANLLGVARLAWQSLASPGLRAHGVGRFRNTPKGRS